MKNLRCLTDTGLVPIRPITVLVGRNSSGKSTFLRAFPLLRQSVLTARNSPILWYAEPSYVDFGSLPDAANNRLAEPSVTFQFRLRLPKDAQVSVGDPPFDVAMTLAGGETPYVSAYEVRVEGHDLQCDFDASGRLLKLVVGGSQMGPKDALLLGGKAHLMPTLQLEDNPGVTFLAAPALLRLDPIKYQTRAGRALMPLLVSALNFLFHGNTSPNTMRAVAQGLRIGSNTAVVQRLESLSNQKRFRRTVRYLNTTKNQWWSIRFDEILKALFAYQLPFVIEATDLVLASVMSRVAYLAPLRVNPQRAYRIQNLAVDEVDPDGKNLAMFLRSLSSAESEGFAAFTRELLGFETQIKSTGMHCEILVKEGDASKFVNLVDVGFGYSEVLPLAATLWASCLRPESPRRPRPALVAVEQPELHLHPAQQAQLAPMFAAAMLRSPHTRILVETHSESLINGLGALVCQGAIKAEDVQIVLFDKDQETGQTTVGLTGYDEDGALQENWPLGFLAPVGERLVRTVAE